MKENSTRDLIVFINQLSLIIDSDISLFEGLELISKKTNSEFIKNIVKTTLDELSMGNTLATALDKNKNLPAIVKNMVNIGEQSGDLSFSLNEISQTLEKEIETSEKIKQAITYPIILSVLMLGVILLLVLKILPMFNDILVSLGGNIPNVTAQILNFSLFISNNIGYIAFITLVIVASIWLYFSSSKGKLKKDELKFSLPFIGDIYSSITAVRFARNLSMLYKAGIPVSIAFSMIKPTISNLYVENLLDEAQEKLDSGKAPDVVIEELNIFPWVLIKLFNVAQTTGHMESMLMKAANHMEKEANEKIAKLTSVIEPILIIILSTIIGIILISVMLPVINIMNTIS